MAVPKIDFPLPDSPRSAVIFPPVKEKIYITKNADSAHRRKESDRKLLDFDIHRKGSFQVREVLQILKALWRRAAPANVVQ